MMSDAGTMQNHTPAPAPAALDPVGLPWLLTARWMTMLAGVAAVFVGRVALDVAGPAIPTLACFVFWIGSNVWLTWRVRTPDAGLAAVAGTLVCADVLLLSWLLLRSGGVLNPVSVFYLVEIVLAALVLGHRWTWIVTALAVGGYAALYLVPTSEMRDAIGMHPEIALHMRGMWFAFALTSLIVAILVTRLVVAVERRDRALLALGERTARATRAAGLATLAAGAAHELGTPLGTIAVAARELERTLATARFDDDSREDARTIRAEADRCRRILEAMAGQSGEPVGETPRACVFEDVVAALRQALTPHEWARVDVDVPADESLVWPVTVVAKALGNIVRNALQASPEDGRVGLRARREAGGLIRIVVEDHGAGMSAEHLGRAGEPFFTTKPAGRGTGLGLFLARSSIEQLAGAVAISSTPGRGTTVIITLPADVVEMKAVHDS